MIDPLVPEALLIRPADAARVLGLSPRRLWALTSCGAIPSRKIGRSVRYSRVELACWVEANCPTEPGAGESIREAASAN